MNRALTHAYERLGWRWVPVMLLIGGAVGQMMLASALFLEVKYLQASSGDYLQLVGIAFLVFTPIMLLAVFVSRDYLVPIVKWVREGRPPEVAPEIWGRTIRVGRVIVTRASLMYGVMIFPFHLIVSPAVLDSGLGVAPALIIFGLGSTAAAWAVITSLVDLMSRPIVRDLAAHLPGGPDEPASGLPLRVKAILTVPVVAFCGALAAGAFVLQVDSPQAHLYVALAAAALVALSFAIPIAAIATGSVLDPVQDLIDATRRIVRGDLSTRLPILTDDELGDLARNFNTMQDGLLEREALRGENVQLVDDLRGALSRVVAATDEERRRMERDLHDGAQQHLVLLKMKLGMLEDAIDRDPDAAKAQTTELKADLGRALAELRDLAHGIYPAILEHEGLAAALRDAVERSPINAQLESNGTARYAPQLEAAVYFCCLEALQNAAKHAPDSMVVVRLAEADGALRFEVADDGPGFDPASQNGTAGLQNMADRIGALGGELRIESAPGAGASVNGRVPITSTSAGPTP
jgi:signal transduction histidine kinase